MRTPARILAALLSLGLPLACLGLASGCDGGGTGGTRPAAGAPTKPSQEQLDQYANPTKGQKKAADPKADLMKKYANPNAK